MQICGNWKINFFLMTVTAIFVIFIDAALLRPTVEPHETNLFPGPVPWLGILTFRENGNNKTAAIGVILVSHNLAIGSAREVATLNDYEWDVGNKTKVMFLDSYNKPWYAKLVNFEQHPDYDKTTFATIALLNLDYQESFLIGDLLVWPFEEVDYPNLDHVFAVGYSDRNQVLKQIVYTMKYISLDDCIHFYNNEELNAKWLRPIRYHCYTVKYSKENCVFDSGMALIRNTGTKWILLGISTWGPGCGLPARFLDFEYFLPWIAPKVGPRRRWKQFWPPEWSPKSYDLDTWVLKHLTNQSMVLRPVKIKDPKDDPRWEKKFGACSSYDKRDGQLIYKDQMAFSITGPTNKAVGVNGLSIYDLRYPIVNYTCIMVFGECRKKSQSRLWYTTSLEQGHGMEPLIVNYPIYNETSIPFYITDTEGKYHGGYLRQKVTHLLFLFEFQDKAFIEVYFYGNSTAKPTSLTTTTTTVTPDFLDESVTRRPVHYITSTRTPPKPKSVPP